VLLRLHGAESLKSQQSGNVNLYSSAIQYVIFLVTTGGMLPWIDRIDRRFLLVTGSVLCMILHFTIAGLMATYGHYANKVAGNANLKWEINGHPAKGVIASSYLFVAVYGLTWVTLPSITLTPSLTLS